MTHPFLKSAVFCAILTVTLFFFACGNEQSQSANDEAALPHNMEQTGNLSEAESGELAAAKGKEATLIDAPTLLSTIKSDSSALLVVSFWKTDCLKCIQLQQALQQIQSKSGEGKLHLVSVNLDEEKMANGVNLVLRKSGISADTYQVKASDGKWMNDISGGWSGNVPAVFIKTKEGIKQFHNKDIASEELGAILQPLLL
jgi:thiol-disulfide isomerase/thioredoxin